MGGRPHLRVARALRGHVRALRRERRADELRLDRRHRRHGGAAAILALLGMGGSPVRRAAALGAATSILWALVATFIKATTDTLTQFGPAGMFTHWPVYALAVSGIAAGFLNQAALHVGPLSISQPLLVIVDPIVSIGLSIWIFGEMFTEDALRLRSRQRRSLRCAWRRPSSPAPPPPPWTAGPARLQRPFREQADPVGLHGGPVGDDG